MQTCTPNSNSHKTLSLAALLDAQVARRGDEVVEKDVRIDRGIAERLRALGN
jgi:hypothetical protein